MSDKKELTGSRTHRATMRGYAIAEGGAGELIEPGQMVPAGQVVSTEWMEPVNKKDAEMARATEEALDPHGADVDLNQLKGAALTAYAAGLSINRGDLDDKGLRAAVTAKRQNDA